MEDSIQELPVDQVPATQEEKELSDWLFSDTTTQETPSPVISTQDKKPIHRLYKLWWVALIFFVLQLPVLSTILHPYFPNPFIQSLIKTLVFIIVITLIIRY